MSLNGVVYVRPTEALFIAITNHGRKTVSQLIADGIDVNRRDHIGQKTLHVAILVKAEGVVCRLPIDPGAQMMSRLVDGRNSLHLAVQMDMAVVTRKTMETCKGGKAKAEKDGKVASEGGESEHLGARTRSRIELMNELVVSVSPIYFP